MTYVDTSVILAHLLAEDRSPPRELWHSALITSRLTHYETWVRIHARGLGGSHGELVRDALSRVAIVELSPLVLGRALEPFPVALRTLDALHLASIDFLRNQHQDVELATYDERLAEVATRLGFRRRGL